MTMECARCSSDLEHCHGTIVEHADGFVECTEPACQDADGLRHAFVIECSMVEGGCACTIVVGTELLLRAS
ncbi:MAG: hypothetical protein ACRDQW_07515 [Haloechinothrix sp.]